jgi:hypothetical protein
MMILAPSIVSVLPFGEHQLPSIRSAKAGVTLKMAKAASHAIGMQLVITGTFPLRQPKLFSSLDRSATIS